MNQKKEIQALKKIFSEFESGEIECKWISSGVCLESAKSLIENMDPEFEELTEDEQKLDYSSAKYWLITNSGYVAPIDTVDDLIAQIVGS